MNDKIDAIFADYSRRMDAHAENMRIGLQADIREMNRKIGWVAIALMGICAALELVAYIATP